MPNGLKSFLRAPFDLIVWVMKTYGKNHDRQRAFMAQPRVAAAFKWAVALTVLVWIAVGLTASEVDRSHLTEVVKGLWSEVQDQNE